MAVEMAIWRMTDAGPRHLVSSPLDSEQRLEDMLAEDPGMCGLDLLVVGRQVRTDMADSLISWPWMLTVALMSLSSSVIGLLATLLPKHSTTGRGYRI